MNGYLSARKWCRLPSILLDLGTAVISLACLAFLWQKGMPAYDITKCAAGIFLALGIIQWVPQVLAYALLDEGPLGKETIRCLYAGISGILYLSSMLTLNMVPWGLPDTPVTGAEKTTAMLCFATLTTASLIMAVKNTRGMFQDWYLEAETIAEQKGEYGL